MAKEHARGEAVDRPAHRLHSSALLLALARLVAAHPRLAAWIALSAGLCAALVTGGRNAEVPLGPWLVILTTAVLVSGMCIAIVTAKDEDEDVTDDASVSPADLEAERRMPTTH